MATSQPTNDEVAKKCLTLHENGLERIGAGNLQPFIGFPEALKRRFNVSLLYTAQSNAAFSDRIAYQLAESERHLVGIGWYMAARDYSPHLTALECEVADPEEMSGIQASAQWPQDLIDRMVGEKFNMSELILGGGYLLLNSAVIPESLRNLRRALEGVYGGLGHKVFPNFDIAHITAGRMSRVPEQAFLDAYVGRMLRVRKSILTSPIIMEVAGVYIGPALTLLDPENARVVTPA